MTTFALIDDELREVDWTGPTHRGMRGRHDSTVLHGRSAVDAVTGEALEIVTYTRRACRVPAGTYNNDVHQVYALPSVSNDDVAEALERHLREQSNFAIEALPTWVDPTVATEDIRLAVNGHTYSTFIAGEPITMDRIRSDMAEMRRVIDGQSSTSPLPHSHPLEHRVRVVALHAALAGRYPPPSLSYLRGRALVDLEASLEVLRDEWSSQEVGRVVRMTSSWEVRTLRGWERAQGARPSMWSDEAFTAGEHYAREEQAILEGRQARQHLPAERPTRLVERMEEAPAIPQDGALARGALTARVGDIPAGTLVQMLPDGTVAPVAGADPTDELEREEVRRRAGYQLTTYAANRFNVRRDTLDESDDDLRARCYDEIVAFRARDNARAERLRNAASAFDRHIGPGSAAAVQRQRAASAQRQLALDSGGALTSYAYSILGVERAHGEADETLRRRCEVEIHRRAARADRERGGARPVYGPDGEPWFAYGEDVPDATTRAVNAQLEALSRRAEQLAADATLSGESPFRDWLASRPENTTPTPETDAE